MTDDEDISPRLDSLWAGDWNDLVELSEDAAAYDAEYWRDNGEPQ